MGELHAGRFQNRTRNQMTQSEPINVPEEESSMTPLGKKISYSLPVLWVVYLVIWNNPIFFQALLFASLLVPVVFLILAIRNFSYQSETQTGKEKWRHPLHFFVSDSIVPVFILLVIGMSVDYVSYEILFARVFFLTLPVALGLVVVNFMFYNSYLSKLRFALDLVKFFLYSFFFGYSYICIINFYFSSHELNYYSTNIISKSSSSDSEGGTSYHIKVDPCGANDLIEDVNVSREQYSSFHNGQEVTVTVDNGLFSIPFKSNIQ